MIDNIRKKKIAVVTATRAEYGVCLLYTSDRIISLLIMFACTGLATMAMLLVNTPVGSETIEGVQGRYLVPFLPLLSITAAYNNSKTLETSSKATRIVIGTSILNYISVLYIFTYILSN